MSTSGPWFLRPFLWLFPPAFRRAYGRDLLDVTAGGGVDARRLGRVRAVRYWFRTVGDLLLSAMAERADGWRGARRAGRPRTTGGRGPVGSGLAGDVRVAARALLKRPGFSATVVLTLGLGVGLNATIFSFINAYLFRPLPVRAPGELVVLAQRTPALTIPHEVSYLNFLDLQAARDIFADVAVHSFESVGLGDDRGDGAAERFWIEWVGANYFSVLGVSPVLGRGFLPSEAVGRAAPSPSVVLSYRSWERRFSGDSAIVGREVRLNGVPVTVVGVAPRGFAGTEPLLAAEAYVPLAALTTLYPNRHEPFHDREGGWFKLIGRLRPGVTAERAQAAVRVLGDRLAAAYPATNTGTSFVVVPEIHSRPDIAVADLMTPIAVGFMTLVVLVLILTCANIVNLMMARASTREREFAIRTALGAGRGRLVRYFLVEGSLLAVVGGGLGYAIGMVGDGLLGSIRFTFDAPIRFDFSPDWRVAVFTLACAAVAALALAVVPALHAGRGDLMASLRTATPERARSGRRLRHVLVAGQVAVCLMLLVAGGLFLKSVRTARQLNFGFRTEGVLLATVDLDLLGYDRDDWRQFYDRLSERISVLPGVEAAGLISHVPLGYSNDMEDISVPGFLGEDGADRRGVFGAEVAGEAFAALELPILEGRGFLPSDRDSTARVAVVNQAAARLFWPDRSAVGQRFQVNRTTRYEVVGVTQDWQYLFVGETPRPFIFYSARQHPSSLQNLVLATSGDPLALIDPIRRVVRELDPRLPVFDVKTMRSHLDGGKALLPLRLAATVAGVFSAVGLTLALVGLYGVVSFWVTQQRRDLGIRIAIGARNGAILRMVVGRGMLVTIVGLAVGLAGSLALAGLLSGLLYGVHPTDPGVLGGGLAILAGAALVASWIPARRATRVDPTVVLREE